MKEYLRTEGDSVTIPYTAPLGTDAVVFSVYDLDLEEYVQSDQSLAKRATVTAASCNGTTITYTASNTFAIGDIVTIIFYKGNGDSDVIFRDVIETVKKGDTL